MWRTGVCSGALLRARAGGDRLARGDVLQPQEDQVEGDVVEGVAAALAVPAGLVDGAVAAERDFADADDARQDE